jgi:hypothetical protein
MKFFWSWQSDTPGPTGRYFVRAALLAAIKQLKQPEDVEEPTTAARREAMELTSDREGVTGSPPLAATIKKKIGECEVFVADITPVSKVPRRRGVKEKRNMNINVGIELGFAIRVEFGVVGTKDYSLVIEQTYDNPYAIYRDTHTDKLIMHNAAPEAIDEALLYIFESFFRMTGYRRPPHLFDFPQKQRAQG